MSYLHIGYNPHNDIICEFSVAPKGISVRQAAEHVAAESSTGTWTEVSTAKPYMKKLAAKIFSIRGKRLDDKLHRRQRRHTGLSSSGTRVKIAYPAELFEANNVPQILSSIAGNIFGMKEISGLRLEDVSFPESIIKSYKGPRHGIAGIKKIMKLNGMYDANPLDAEGVRQHSVHRSRPIIGSVIKPKIGLRTKDHARIAHDIWTGGCDFVKDDENLSSQKFNPFYERFLKTIEMRDLAQSETGEKKVYYINITAETKEMMKRAEFVKDHGGEYIMIDIITTGWSALQTIRNGNFGLAIHAHRAMHAAFDRNPKHGVSMMVIAKLSRLIGVDQIHTGTIIGKLEGGAEVIDINYELKQQNVKAHNNVLQQKWHHIKPVLPVASGGLHPGHVPKIMELFGTDMAMQFGGGIHGHPQGSKAGAMAVRQAIDATMQGIPLKEYAKTHKELAAAISKWGLGRTKYYF